MSNDVAARKDLGGCIGEVSARIPGEGNVCPSWLEDLVGVRASGRLMRAGLGSRQALRCLVRRPLPELAAEAGLGAAGARRLRAAAALGRSLARADSPGALRTPADVASHVAHLLAPQVEGQEQEQFHTVLLDARHRPIGCSQVSIGTLTASIVHPREVFRAAVRCAAAAVVVAHNHPSGDPEPSAEDLVLTKRLISSGELLGIPLLDHVVLGDGCWVSLRSRMPFNGAEPRPTDP